MKGRRRQGWQAGKQTGESHLVSSESRLHEMAETLMPPSSRGKTGARLGTAVKYISAGLYISQRKTRECLGTVLGLNRVALRT